MAPPNNRLLIKGATFLHRLLYRVSGGGIGGRFGKAPMLLLTTTGRRSGKPRTVPLLYLADGERIVVVGSNGGDDRDPAWWLNLQHDPRGQMQIGRRRRAVTAGKADPQEKARLWPQITALYAGYDEYQTRTAREIPLVVLRPEA
ncbi:MAG: nitroreductase family deazaflavin-dependent oxidoreductase [Dehalococcoidia bacterium]|nr:nitroreductase family deazaflavin-dependent oxidoreductase [Dehalococcoidia bacterium]